MKFKGSMCCNCKYIYRDEDKLFYCRRYPPVCEDDYCGEYKKKC
jgi:hypothetical protein